MVPAVVPLPSNTNESQTSKEEAAENQVTADQDPPAPLLATNDVEERLPAPMAEKVSQMQARQRLEEEQILEKTREAAERRIWRAESPSGMQP
jgi:hypothetical protein